MVCGTVRDRDVNTNTTVHQEDLQEFMNEWDVNIICSSGPLYHWCTVLQSYWTTALLNQYCKPLNNYHNVPLYQWCNVLLNHCFTRFNISVIYCTTELLFCLTIEPLNHNTTEHQHQCMTGPLYFWFADWYTAPLNRCMIWKTKLLNHCTNELLLSQYGWTIAYLWPSVPLSYCTILELIHSSSGPLFHWWINHGATKLQFC